MMSEVIRLETSVFFCAVLHGAFLTLLYDLLRMIRRVIRHGPPAVSAEDLIYWLAAGLLTFRFAFQRTDGIVRGYTAFGFILGSVLYHELCSDTIVRLGVKVMRPAAEMIRKSWKVMIVFFCKKR